VDLTDSPARTASAPRVTGWLALAGVSLIAGIASYFHALTVVKAAGATPPVAYLVPALADLVILGASADMIAASRQGAGRPRLTMLSLGVGIAVTLAMNVAAGSDHGIGGRLVAGWPALAFTLALESLAGLVRRGRGGSDTPPAPAATTVTVGCGHGVAADRDGRLLDAYLHMRDCLGATPSYRGIGAAFDVHHDTVRQLVMAADGEQPDEVPVSPMNGSHA
jgi:O-antigen/teichoic acid export membrane protein